MLDYPCMGATRAVAWGLAAVALAALVGSAGCGGDGADPSPSPAATTSPAVEFAFEITDGRASPPLDRATVPRGSPVRIVVSSDQPDELHLHGYDRSAAITPDQPGVIELIADQTGLFELEAHEAGQVLLQLLVE